MVLVSQLAHALLFRFHDQPEFFVAHCPEFRWLNTPKPYCDLVRFLRDAEVGFVFFFDDGNARSIQ